MRLAVESNSKTAFLTVASVALSTDVMNERPGLLCRPARGICHACASDGRRAVERFDDEDGEQEEADESSETYLCESTFPSKWLGGE